MAACSNTRQKGSSYMKFRYSIHAIILSIILPVILIAGLANKASASEKHHELKGPVFDASEGFFVNNAVDGARVVFYLEDGALNVYRPAPSATLNGCGDLATGACLAKQRTGFIYELHQVTTGRTPHADQMVAWTQYFASGGNKTDAIEYMYHAAGLDTQYSGQLAWNLIENTFDYADYDIVDGFITDLEAGTLTPQQMISNLIVFSRTYKVRLYAFEEYRIADRLGFDLGTLEYDYYIPPYVPCSEPIGCKTGA
jgi:hypothetical protein